jgi:hypothetical protein
VEFKGINKLKYITVMIIGLFFLAASGCGSSDTSPSPTTGASSFKLSWIVPTQRANGDALMLNEVKGYQFCYTVDDGSETCETFDVSDPAQSEYTIPNWPAGVYRITLATIDTNNSYSDKSAVLEHRVN